MYFYRRMDVKDWTYHTGRIILFNGPEPALGILAGCLPVMSPCLRVMSNKIKSFRLGKAVNQQVHVQNSEHPPTIGHAKRVSLRAMRLSSTTSEGFDRLNGQTIIVPLTDIAVSAVEEIYVVKQ